MSNRHSARSVLIRVNKAVRTDENFLVRLNLCLNYFMNCIVYLLGESEILTIPDILDGPGNMLVACQSQHIQTDKQLSKYC